jgi:chaperonin cofactor prefoldin
MMPIGERAILKAVGIIAAEERAARDKAVAELRARIEALEQRLATVERAVPASRLRAVNE